MTEHYFRIEPNTDEYGDHGGNLHIRLVEDTEEPYPLEVNLQANNSEWAYGKAREEGKWYWKIRIRKQEWEPEELPLLEAVTDKIREVIAAYPDDRLTASAARVQARREAAREAREERRKQALERNPPVGPEKVKALFKEIQDTLRGITKQGHFPSVDGKLTYMERAKDDTETYHAHIIRSVNPHIKWHDHWQNTVKKDRLHKLLEDARAGSLKVDLTIGWSEPAYDDEGNRDGWQSLERKLELTA